MEPRQDVRLRAHIISDDFEISAERAKLRQPVTAYIVHCMVSRPTYWDYYGLKEQEPPHEYYETFRV